MQVDPLGFGAGDSNLYRYVGNRPTNATDPSGLADKPGKPSLPPKATEEEKQAAIKWIKKYLPKLPDKGYTIYGPVGTMTENNWQCSGLVFAVVRENYDWKVPPSSSLPLNKPVKIDLIDQEIKKLGFGGFEQIKDGNVKFVSGMQKIVVYGIRDKRNNTCDARHYAVQLPDGKWIS
jgi:hypothetical protein